MITIKLKETNFSFRGKVNDAIASILNKTLRRKKGAIVRDIRALIPQWIKSQPEMIDLSSDNSLGSLSAQLGLPFGSGPNVVEAITDAMVRSVAIDVKDINKRNLSGGLKLNFMSETFKDLIDLPEGHVIYEKGDLHWLRWLLEEGFKVIVVGYSFSFRDGGRSGGGIMEKGGIWRVPPEYAGTRSNNFVTRALRNPENEKQIQRVLERHIK